MPAFKEKLKPAFILVCVLTTLFLVGPFLWDAVLFGVKGIIFHWILDYGFYALLLFGGGGYLWWKTRKKI
jgi:hypothetical protein